MDRELSFIPLDRDGKVRKSKEDTRFFPKTCFEGVPMRLLFSHPEKGSYAVTFYGDAQDERFLSAHPGEKFPYPFFYAPFLMFGDRDVSYGMDSSDHQRTGMRAMGSFAGPVEIFPGKSGVLLHRASQIHGISSLRAQFFFHPLGSDLVFF